MKIINTILGFSVSILVYKEEIAVGVALLTGIYMIVQIALGVKKFIKKEVK